MLNLMGKKIFTSLLSKFFLSKPERGEDQIFKIRYKQEMSQSRDDCPQRNRSSIRHIREKLAVI